MTAELDAVRAQAAAEDVTVSDLVRNRLFEA